MGNAHQVYGKLKAYDIKSKIINPKIMPSNVLENTLKIN